MRPSSFGIPPSAFRIRKLAFTILELMLAIGIFAMVLAAIYATWMAILKGSRAGLKAAAEVQRARIALRTLEDAFTGAELFMANMKYYLFFADTSGDMATVSLAARVPDDFLGAEQTKLLDQKIRRLNFYTQPDKDGTHDLMMSEVPILAMTNNNYEAYTVTLAREVTHFQLAFYDGAKREWLDEWTYTNRLPALVQIALGIGKTAGRPDAPHEIVYSLVALPSIGVGPEVQGGTAVPPLNPQNPNPLNPNNPNPNPTQNPNYNPTAPFNPAFPNQPKNPFNRPGFPK